MCICVWIVMSDCQQVASWVESCRLTGAGPQNLATLFQRESKETRGIIMKDLSRQSNFVKGCGCHINISRVGPFYHRLSGYTICILG